MEATPSPWPFFLYLLVSFVIGSVLGRMDRLTSWKPTAYAGAACLGLGEPAILFLYNNGYMTLNEAFSVGTGFLAAGALGFGFGLQKLGKTLQLQQAQASKDAKRAPEGEPGNRPKATSEHSRKATHGTCPNCATVIPIASTECNRCDAFFGEGSSWKVTPL
jgi:hypothetical protein